MKRLPLWVLLLALSAEVAAAQVIEQGTTILTTANAIMPGCTDSENLPGATEATASCSSMGYAGASSAATSLTSSPSGADLSAVSQASATSIGPPANQNASATGNSIASISWRMLSDTLYSFSTATIGGATASFQENSVPLPPSGVATPGTQIYTLRADAFSFAQAFDADGLSTATAGPRSASAHITFAPVGSPTLIQGTISVGGTGVPGLLVEAIAGSSVIASALTGDDGSYLLPDLSGSVVLRVSDPAGQLATETSGPQIPPATFDTELAPAVPVLTSPFAGALLFVLVTSSAVVIRRPAGR